MRNWAPPEEDLSSIHPHRVVTDVCPRAANPLPRRGALPQLFGPRHARGEDQQLHTHSAPSFGWAREARSKPSNFKASTPAVHAASPTRSLCAALTVQLFSSHPEWIRSVSNLKSHFWRPEAN